MEEMQKMSVLLKSQEISNTLDRLASQIIEKHDSCENVILVGIERRGADLARRLSKLVGKKIGSQVKLGTLDINLYRDDWTSIEGKPHIGQSHIPEHLEDLIVILVDDVLFTGRTIRAALEAVLDYGRPKTVELMVLIDRGHRELPISANYVGRTISTKKNDHVDVHLSERDGTDIVIINT